MIIPVKFGEILASSLEDVDRRWTDRWTMVADGYHMITIAHIEPMAQES